MVPSPTYFSSKTFPQGFNSYLNTSLKIKLPVGNILSIYTYILLPPKILLKISNYYLKIFSIIFSWSCLTTISQPWWVLGFKLNLICLIDLCLTCLGCWTFLWCLNFFTTLCALLAQPYKVVCSEPY